MTILTAVKVPFTMILAHDGLVKFPQNSLLIYSKFGTGQSGSKALQILQWVDK